MQYGSGGFQETPSGLVLENFLTHAPEHDSKLNRIPKVRKPCHSARVVTTNLTVFVMQSDIHTKAKSKRPSPLRALSSSRNFLLLVCATARSTEQSVPGTCYHSICLFLIIRDLEGYLVRETMSWPGLTLFQVFVVVS